MPKNIVLVGMPASGKSTIGVILAKELKYRFTDTDLVLQEATDQTLVEIIAQRGLDGFLQLENDTVAALEARRSVIATGGSVIYGREAMEHLKANGVVVYIQPRYEVIQSRLTNITTRGVAMREGETLYDLFRERTPLYERYADVTLEADGLTTEQAVQAIIRLLDV
ncbi:MAG: shikimate kinase [Clostridiales bacterium]|nr:shikimate kinase [Clostridiales bacterium]